MLSITTPRWCGNRQTIQRLCRCSQLFFSNSVRGRFYFSGVDRGEGPIGCNSPTKICMLLVLIKFCFILWNCTRNLAKSFLYAGFLIATASRVPNSFIRPGSALIPAEGDSPASYSRALHAHTFSPFAILISIYAIDWRMIVSVNWNWYVSTSTEECCPPPLPVGSDMLSYTYDIKLCHFSGHVG